MNNSAFNERIQQTRSRLLDVVDAMVGNLHDRANPPALPAPPPPVTRRLVANTLGLWQFCANSKCKRGECCRGEPLHCLRYTLNLLPVETVDALLPHTARRARQIRKRS